MIVLKGFRTYELARELFDGCQKVTAHYRIKDQLTRASLSVMLNVAEGSAKPTERDRRRLYAVALGSCREVQAILQVLGREDLFAISNEAGACLYRLVHPKR